MDIEQLRDEVGSLYCELQAAIQTGDNDWIADCQEALKEAQEELREAEEAELV